MINVTSLIAGFGYLGIAAMVFAESGLLIGIFFPGDSLLFTAGFLASQHTLNIGILIAVSVIFAITGDSVGYWLGHRFGPRVFSRSDGIFLNKAHIATAERFYAKHGSKTIILARFVPVVRSIAPILAGVGAMAYDTFITFNIIGGLLWGAGIPLAGYWLGRVIPNVDHYLLPIVVLIVVISVLPGIWHLWHERRQH